MKRYISFFAAAIILASCGNNNSDSKNADSSATAGGTETTTGTADMSNNPDYQKGLALVGASDCFTCHKTSENLVGPAYADVANKYAGVDTAVTYLAHRIINGVTEDKDKNWASVTNNGVMTPHADLSEADAEQMVKYVLLLKTK